MGELSRVGRKTICTPEVIENIVANIILGLNVKDAANIAGVGKTSYFAWILRGEKELKRISDNPELKINPREEIFVEFVNNLKLAVPKRKQRSLSQLQLIARGGIAIQEKTTITRTTRDGGTTSEEKIVVKETAPSWQAFAWLLERLHPEEFAKRVQLQNIEEELKPHLPAGYTLEEAVEQFRERLVNQGSLPDKEEEEEEEDEYEDQDQDQDTKIIDLPNDA